MDKERLFRMNFILQDNTATTTKTYLVKLIESILFESHDAISVDQICDLLKEQYLLEFTSEEIFRALKNTLKKGKHIEEIEGKYSLVPSYANELSKCNPIAETLKEYVKKAIIEVPIEAEEAILYQLITRYLYFCFNSNKEALLALIDGKQLTKVESLDVNNDEIMLINAFLTWKDEGKNKLIYQIVSYCYVYCTLTTKKDVLLSKEIFKNKHFYLDANIIFRLAGINNDDRQNTINSFVIKCNEVGIKLSYTSITLDELYRVISSKVSWLRGITHSREPLDINLESYENDFYNMYIKWCKQPTNRYDDFNSFQRYLTDKVADVLCKLDYVCVNDFRKDTKKYSECVRTLSNYKEQNGIYQKSVASIETDVINVLHIENGRNVGAINLFSTNLYFISADQNLVGWSQEYFSGVPLIVLPSVWLTILLRFTGRTSNDYSSFVSFMNLRTHNSVDLDIFSVIRELGFHTSNKELTEKIVREIMVNKQDYIDEDPEKIVNKAFDEVRKEEKIIQKEEFNKVIADREEKLLREKEEALKISLEQEKNKNIDILVNKSVKKNMCIVKRVKKIKLILIYTIGILLVGATILWAYGVEPIFTGCEKMFPQYISTFADKCVFLGGAWGILLLINAALDKILNCLSGIEREKKLRLKYENYFRDILSDN